MESYDVHLTMETRFFHRTSCFNWQESGKKCIMCLIIQKFNKSSES